MNDIRVIPAREHPDETLRRAMAVASRPPNWVARRIDAAVGTLFPGWGRRRYRARMQQRREEGRRVLLSAYDAAVNDRTTADWNRTNTSADAAIIDEIPPGNARARAALRNDGYARSALGGYRRNVVGIGITPRANVRHPETGERIEDVTALENTLWERWATNPGHCDIEHKRTFQLFQELAISDLVANGNFFLIQNYIPERDHVGLVLQAFEWEQLDQTITRNNDNGNTIRGGVEIDGYGAAVAYHVHVKHPLTEWTSISARVEAERVIHVMRPERALQTLGYTWLSAVLRDLREFKMYRSFQILAAKFESCFGVFIHNDPNYEPAAGWPGLEHTGDTADTGLDSKGNRQISLEPGMVTQLTGAQDVKFMDPKRPGGEYGPFSRQTIGQIGAGAGLDYPTIARDYAGMPYVALRMAKGDLYDEMDPIQQILVDLMCRKIWRSFHTYAIREGRYGAEVAGNFTRSADWAEAYLAANWAPPPRRDIDEAKAAAARKLDLENKTITIEKIYNHRGESWQDALQQHSEVQQFAGDLDPPVELPWSKIKPIASPSEPKPRENQPEENDEPAKQSRRWSDDAVTDAIVEAAIGEES